MYITPKISSDAATSEAQNNSAQSSSLQSRRNAAPIQDAIESGVPQSLNSLTDAPGADAADLDHDIPDAHAADNLMASLRTGIPGQPGTTMLAQANLSPQSVYDLLR